MIKLAIITTHPVQYNAPLFRLLTERKNILVKVFYTWSQTEFGIKYDPGFDKTIKWDIPLLDGYEYCFVENISEQPSSNKYKGINNPTLIKEIQDWNADALMVYGWNLKSHLKAIRFFKNKVPVLFRGDSTLLDEKPGIKKIIRRAVLKFIYSYVGVALYVGVANKAYFKAHGVKEKQLAFMPHAIDNNRFANNEILQAEADNFRNQLNIPLPAIVFLFAGKIDDNKNVPLLLKVFSNINSEAHLIIAGSGTLESFLKDQYKDNKNIHFLGFQNQMQMPMVYNLCNVFVLPSKSETWGLAINEAMAAGKAIIASDNCGAVYDLVNNNVNGFVIKTSNELALQVALNNFIKEKNIALSMGLKSKEIIQQYSYLQDSIAVENVLLNINNLN